MGLRWSFVNLEWRSPVITPSHQPSLIQSHNHNWELILPRMALEGEFFCGFCHKKDLKSKTINNEIKPARERFSSFDKKEKYDRCISLLLPKIEKYIYRISLFLKREKKRINMFLYLCHCLKWLRRFWSISPGPWMAEGDKKRHCFVSTLSLSRWPEEEWMRPHGWVVSEFGFWTSPK